MPDYLPPLQLPTGLAEQLIALKAQNPWGAAAANIGQSLGQGIQQHGQNQRQAQALKAQQAYQQQQLELQKQQTLLSPEQQLQYGLGQRAPGPFQPGQQPPQQSSGQNMPVSLAEKLMTAKNQQALGMVTITPEAAATPAFQKLGLTAGVQIAKQTFDALVKPPSGTQNKASTDLSNMKVITDYAAKNGISLDALRPGGMGGWNSNNSAMVAQMIKDHPDYNAAELKKEFAGQMAATTRGAGTAAAKAADIKVNLDSAHGGFIAVMDMAKPIAERMGKGDIGLFNKAVQAGKTEFNDEDSIALNTYLDEAAGNYARILKGGSASISDEDKIDAKKILSNKLNAGGLDAVEKAMETEYKGRLSGLPGEGKKSKDGSGKKSASVDYSKMTPEELQAEAARQAGGQ